MAEAKETFLILRFDFMSFRFVYRAMVRRNSPVLQSFEYVEQFTHTITKRQQALGSIPILKHYAIQKYVLKIVQRSPLNFNYDLKTYTYVDAIDDSLMTSLSNKSSDKEYRTRFQELSSVYSAKGPLVFTDGSKSEALVGAECRLRSNHYNLAYSLHRKGIIDSPTCFCGNSRQDINHIIFYCNQCIGKSIKLRAYLKKYEGRLKSFEPNIETSNFSVKFNFIFPYSLLLSRYIFSSDAPTPLIHSNNTEHLAL
ncbi:hypothetical protein ALC57_03089 [Trachymyrmex cornetzi]|uniref:Uncharacterized protein n=1 Tax=Trachymyrmex cornetzi TaxID=471704 RepID=A0A151JMJ2_9HYME|nr:hypothetical protein ALC57_03089 [Trachymyrmex cornetzi]